MTSINTKEVENAFNDLILELQKVKDLNSIAESYKEHVEVLANKLQDYYRISKDKDIIIGGMIEDGINKLSIIQEECIKPLESFEQNITQLINSNIQLESQLSNIVAGSVKNILSEMATMNDRIEEDNKIFINNLSNTIKDYIDCITLQLSKVEYRINNSINELNKTQCLVINEASQKILTQINESQQLISKSQNEAIINTRKVIEERIESLNNIVHEKYNLTLLEYKQYNSSMFLELNQKLAHLCKLNSSIKTFNIVLVIITLFSLIYFVIK